LGQVRGLTLDISALARSAVWPWTSLPWPGPGS